MSTWHIDPVHSEIAFKIKHLMVSTVRGNFTDFEGTITAADDSFDGGTISFGGKINSIDTKNQQRDGHLKSADFFDAEKYPIFSFVSSSVNKVGEGDLDVVGDLTLKGVTKSVPLHVTVNGVSKNMEGVRVVGFDVLAKIDRKEFGLTWNAPLETGGVVLGEMITIEALIEAKEV